MPKNISQRSFFNFVQIFVLICSFILPHWAVGSVSDLRLKTLFKFVRQHSPLETVEQSLT